MRQWVVVLGFFIIVLIVIAGCASQQNGATTGPQGQNPAQGNNNVKTTSANSWTPTPSCDTSPVNSTISQKFLPTIAGWTKKGSMYYSSDYYCMIDVEFIDARSCTGLSVDDVLNLALLNNGTVDKTTTIVNKIDNFHGYPAVHSITITKLSGQMDGRYEYVLIGINNRLYVQINNWLPTVHMAQTLFLKHLRVQLITKVWPHRYKLLLLLFSQNKCKG